MSYPGVRRRLRWFQFVCLATMPTLILWGASHNLCLALSATAMLVAIVGAIECILAWTERVMAAMSTYKSLLSRQQAITRSMVEVVGKCVRKEEPPSRERPRTYN